jgi:hypothetical protein
MTTELSTAPTLTAHEHIGFELGWDYAHYRLVPPAPYAQEPSPLRHGWLAGQATFGERTLQPTRPVRKWLQLRLHAWLRGRSVELVQVTPHYLQQIDVSHCPITRVSLSAPKPAASRQAPRGGQGNLGAARRFLESAPKPAASRQAPRGGQGNLGAARRFLESAPKPAASRQAPRGGQGNLGAARRFLESSATLDSTDGSRRNEAPAQLCSEGATTSRLGCALSEALHFGGSVDRVRNDAGYAAGNLAVMSTKANHAKAGYGFHDALRFVKQIEAGKLGGIDGLSAAQWSRVAVLCSFVEPLSHDEACTIPMLVLPPNRLRLFNPVQALQAFISQQLLAPGWSHRASRFEDLLPGKPARRAFQTFFHALLPRVLEAGRGGAVQHTRWAIEDAWRNPLVLKRWIAFARLLTSAQCEALVARATARKLGSLRVQQLADEQATEGWNLESRGYVPHAVLMKRWPATSSHGRGDQRADGAVQARLPL